MMVADEWLLVDLYYECLEELNKKPNKNIKKKRKRTIEETIDSIKRQKMEYLLIILREHNSWVYIPSAM